MRKTIRRISENILLISFLLSVLFLPFILSWKNIKDNYAIMNNSQVARMYEIEGKYCRIVYNTFFNITLLKEEKLIVCVPKK